ncbi:MAG: hypothetical protein FRX49_01469 [Trebouxia sp. A1-2]|nr:MAG: hypothetical protein FRX49_01469 [Trebouxia sp. A1-2]
MLLRCLRLPCGTTGSCLGTEAAQDPFSGAPCASAAAVPLSVADFDGEVASDTLMTSGKAMNGDHNSCATCVWDWGLQDEASASSVCQLTMSGGSRGRRVAEALWGSCAALVAGIGARREARARRVCLLGRGNSALIHTALRRSFYILMFGHELPTVGESAANQTGQNYANLGDYGQGVYCPQSLESQGGPEEQSPQPERLAWSRAERRMGWKGRGGLGAEGSLSASCPVPLPGKPSLSTDGPCLVPSTVTGTDSPESPELAAGKSACSHEKPPSTSGSPVLMLEESTAAADAGIWREAYRVKGLHCLATFCTPELDSAVIAAAEEDFAI